MERHGWHGREQEEGEGLGMHADRLLGSLAHSYVGRRDCFSQQGGKKAPDSIFRLLAPVSVLLLLRVKCFGNRNGAIF